MINVWCYCFGYHGVQQHGRSFVYALGRYNKIALFPLDRINHSMLRPPFVQLCLDNAASEHAYNIGLGIGLPDQMQKVSGKRKIAFITWETTKLPRIELQRLADFDEIWIPSAWGKSVLINNGFEPERIHVVPEGVDVKRYRPLKSIDQNYNQRPFRFLCIAKWEKRKGIDILLRAYAEAFKPDEPVELILHCHNTKIKKFSIEAAVKGIKLPRHAPLRYSYPVSEPEMIELINQCDALVLPTRGEGWGLPIIEAMACAKPVIVTDYSAHRDYVNSDNGYLIPVKQMVQVDDPLNYNPKYDYGLWAEPDVEELAGLLRHVLNNRAEAKRKGMLARKEIESAWTWDHAAQKAMLRLKPYL